MERKYRAVKEKGVLIMADVASGIVIGIFISCLLIQWSAGRISSKLDDVVFILRQLRDREG